MSREIHADSMRCVQNFLKCFSQWHNSIIFYQWKRVLEPKIPLEFVQKYRCSSLESVL